MKVPIRVALILMGVVGCTGAAQVQNGALTGTVERVWEDGFELNTGDLAVNVDVWDLCGDNTQQNVSVGDELTVDGEFSGGEFDAATITNPNGEDICSAAGQTQSSPSEQPQGSARTGTVEWVWEDGFNLNTGDRNSYPGWLAMITETQHRVTLYIKLHSEPKSPQDYHLQAEIYREKWEALQNRPFPWQLRVCPPPQYRNGLT